MIDLELATTNQILRELNKRNKSFIMLFDVGSGIANADMNDTLECHVANMNPQDTINILSQAESMLCKIAAGDRPDNFSFITVDENDHIEIVDIDKDEEEEEEEEIDPWQ